MSHSTLFFYSHEHIVGTTESAPFNIIALPNARRRRFFVCRMYDDFYCQTWNFLLLFPLSRIYVHSQFIYCAIFVLQE